MAAASVAVVVVVGVVAFFGVGAEVTAVGGDAIVVVVTIFRCGSISSSIFLSK